MADSSSIRLDRLARLVREAKNIARRFRDLTGRPLGITGEVAEYEAARLLKLALATARQSGYDATRGRKAKEELLQIKGRCILTDKPGQRLGKIRLDRRWHAVLPVLLDSEFEPLAIFEAPRRTVAAALKMPGSKARNERGALSVSQFKAIAKQVWRRS